MKVDEGLCQLLQLDQAELGLTICPPIRTPAAASAHHICAQKEHCLQALVAAKPALSWAHDMHALQSMGQQQLFCEELALPLLCERGICDTTNKLQRTRGSEHGRKVSTYSARAPDVGKEFARGLAGAALNTQKKGTSSP